MNMFCLTVEYGERRSMHDFEILYHSRADAEAAILHYGCGWPSSDLEKSRAPGPCLCWPGKDWTAMGYSIREMTVRAPGEL